MTHRNEVEFADSLSRRRPLATAIAALYFVAIQPFVHPGFGPGDSSARGYGWAINAAILLLLLIPAVGFAWGRRVRELVNDEVSRLNARTATGIGFWIAMALALALFLLPVSRELTARQAIYLLVTPATGSALLAFAWLERRANRDG